MNKTKIEWADYTWNPVTGCLHDCPYCYARKIARRFGMKGEDRIFHFLGMPEYRNIYVPESELQICPYPYGFDPTFHAYRLGEPARKTKAAKVFVCSMADLFGDWVPDEWIKRVFAACEAAPQHTYMFLTKNPKRYCELANQGQLPHDSNFWFGTTITKAGDLRFPGNGINWNTFLSIEPLLGPLDAGIGTFGGDSWFIVGAETGNRKDKIIPKLEWVNNIVETAKLTNAAVFMKESLVPIVGENNMLRQWPESMEVPK